MRRTTAKATLLALVLSGLAVAACGKGGYTVTVGTSPPGGSSAAHARGKSAPAAPRGGRAERERRARALAYAHAVNIGAADVPGFQVAPRRERETPAAERRLEQQLARCAGLSGPLGPGNESGTLAHASSPNFQLSRGALTLSVSSEVGVTRSAAQAATLLAALRSPRLRACFGRYIAAHLEAQRFSGARVVGVKVDAGTPPAPGAAGGFAWRVTATLAVRGIEVPLYLDVLGFVDGPAQVTLTSTGVLRPFPARAQEQLYSELLSRARSHTP